VRKTRKLKLTLVVLAVAVVAFWLFRPGGYSETHPYFLHNCQRMAEICPSRYATWTPPGGSNPSSRYLYGLCACSAGVHVNVG
jgi:hypothetical protein